MDAENPAGAKINFRQTPGIEQLLFGAFLQSCFGGTFRLLNGLIGVDGPIQRITRLGVRDLEGLDDLEASQAKAG